MLVIVHGWSDSADSFDHISTDGDAVDVHDASVERRRLVPEGGERLGGATCGRRTQGQQY